MQKKHLTKFYIIIITALNKVGTEGRYLSIYDKLS